MKKLPSLLLLCTVAALPSCAEMAYRADVGVMFPVAKGRIALQNEAGNLSLHDNQNDFESNMGLGDSEVSPYVHLQADKEKHRFRVHGFVSNAEGTGTLAGAYGGLPAGTQVSTSMDFYALQATYAWQVFRDEYLRVALGGTLGVYGLDLAARSTTGREEVETSLIVPMPYFEVEGFLGPVIVGGDAAIMAGHFRDGNGRYGDVEAYVKVRPHEDFEVMAGYRYLLLDAHGTATSRDFDADVEVRGFFVGGGIRF
jgi:hypothetical protein